MRAPTMPLGTRTATVSVMFGINVGGVIGAYCGLFGAYMGAVYGIVGYPSMDAGSVANDVCGTPIIVVL